MRNKCMVLPGILLFLSLVLFGCGGGGGSSSTPPPGPLIQALLFSFPTGSIPPAAFENAMVSVTDSSNGTSITTATVIMNGVNLTYDAFHQGYEGNVTVSPGGGVTLSVTVGGKTYTASGTQFTVYPTISSPVSGATFTASSPNTVTWTAGAPLTNAVYLLGVLDAADPIGGIAYFQGLATNVNSFPIPANSLTAGSRVVLVGITTPVLISGAAINSAFVFGGFNYVPITVNP